MSTTAAVTRAQRAAAPRLAFAVAMIVMLCAVAPCASARAQSTRVRSGFLVRPDTIGVGDPFQLVVSVVVPDGARVEWPAITDTAAVVVMREPARIESVPDGVMRRETATYELTAWNVGSLTIGLADGTVRDGETALTVPISMATIFVRTVLPGDTTLHVPKPAKALFPRVIPWWQQWWPAFAILAALLLLWWLVRRRRAKVTRAPRVALDIYARALHDFDRLERLALHDAGERGRAVALAVEILRVYLAERVPEGTLSLTSAELLAVTDADSRVPRDRLTSLLAESDAIKFARRAAQAPHAAALTMEARDIVESIEVAHRARLAEAQAAREAAIHLERASRDAENDNARKRSRQNVGVS